MPRKPRIILPGFPHHVTHRGNRRAPIFCDDNDRRFYLNKFKRYAKKYEVRIYSYSLMPNHVHHISVPGTESALSCCLHDLHGVYADYFNLKYGLVGHLWQERFFACVLDDSHLWNAVRYVETNAVRAGIVVRAEDYRWSSARDHCGLAKDPLLDPQFPPDGLIPDWAEWLVTGLEETEITRIRKATRTGVPYATDSFIRELERIFSARLLPRKRGRRPRSR